MYHKHIMWQKQKCPTVGGGERRQPKSHPLEYALAVLTHVYSEYNDVYALNAYISYIGI